MKGRGLMEKESPAGGDEPRAINPHKRISAPKITGPAMKRKHGGRAEREEEREEKEHEREHERKEHEKVERAKGGRAARKHGGFVHGEKAHKNAGREERARGGRTGSNHSPLSSAHAGHQPKGRKTAGSVN